MATHVLIVRHGQSTWNALGKWQGHANPPLSKLGKRQSLAASKSLDRRFDRYLSSDLDRATQTAKAIAGAHGKPHVEQDVSFRERSAGEWEGLTRAEIDARWPNWQDQPWRPDNFETDIDVLARVLPGLDTLAANMSHRNESTALVISHGGVIRALDRHFEVEAIPIPNLAGRWLHHDGRWRTGDVVALAADVTDSDVE